MSGEDVLADHLVPQLVRPIDEEEHQIEATEERRVRLDVLRDRLPAVVMALPRVGRGEDGSARGHLRHDPCLGDADLLLLHGLQ